VIQGAEIRAKAVEINLKELQSKVDNFTQTKKRVPNNLQMRLAQSTKESLELKQTMLQNQEAMVKVREKYEADKQRFKVLIAKTP